MNGQRRRSLPDTSSALTSAWQFAQQIGYDLKYTNDLLPKSNQHEINKIARIVTSFKVNFIMVFILLGQSRQATLGGSSSLHWLLLLCQ
jgi:hypothetical protein